MANSSDIPQELINAFSTSATSTQQFVVMMCGISGSGKSTLSHSILSQYPNFICLSIDAYIYTHHGLYGVDYEKDKYGELQGDAERGLKEEFKGILRDGKRDVVLDLSFYDRAYRDDWRDIVRDEGKGVKVVLVFFDFDGKEEVLWERIEGRRAKGRVEGREGDSAAVVNREMLRGYIAGFERPGIEEGAIVLSID